MMKSIFPIDLTAQSFHAHTTNLENRIGSKHLHTSPVNGKSSRKSVFWSSSRVNMTCMVTVVNSEFQQEEEGNGLIGVRLNYDQTLPPWGNIEEIQNSQPLEPHNTEKLACKIKPKLHFLEETDEGLLSKRLLALSRTNKVTSALELYMSMKSSGLRPNPHACNSLISSLLRNSFSDDAFKVFDMMRKNDKETITGHTCSLVLKAVGTLRGFDSGLAMFTELENEGVLKNGGCDAIVYNTMMSLCRKLNNWAETERMWKLMKDNGIEGTTVTYSLLVSIFVRCSQTELAIDAYNEMIQNKLEPREDTMRAMISVCTKEGKCDLALGVFQRMLDSGFNPNMITYNSLINSLGKAGEVELAFQVFNHMKSSSHTPDAYTWNALISALNRATRYEDALRLFESINREKSFQLDSHLYNTALLSCQRLGLWDQSLQLLWQMEASGQLVSTSSYNFVLGACEVARKPTVSLQVYEQMVHKKCTPNMFTYLSLVRSCVGGSLWSEVMEVLDHVTPNVSLYNAVIHGMCLQVETTSAKMLYMKMHENGLIADGETHALMAQILKKGLVHQTRR